MLWLVFFLDLVRTYNDVLSFLVKSKMRDLTQRYSGLGFNRVEVVVVFVVLVGIYSVWCWGLNCPRLVYTIGITSMKIYAPRVE